VHAAKGIIQSSIMARHCFAIYILEVTGEGHSRAGRDEDIYVDAGV